MTKAKLATHQPYCNKIDIYFNTIFLFGLPLLLLMFTITQARNTSELSISVVLAITTLYAGIQWALKAIKSKNTSKDFKVRLCGTDILNEATDNLGTAEYQIVLADKDGVILADNIEAFNTWYSGYSKSYRTFKDLEKLIIKTRIE